MRKQWMTYSRINDTNRLIRLKILVRHLLDYSLYFKIRFGIVRIEICFSFVNHSYYLRMHLTIFFPNEAYLIYMKINKIPYSSYSLNNSMYAISTFSANSMDFK